MKFPALLFTLLPACGGAGFAQHEQHSAGDKDEAAWKKADTQPRGEDL
ncbi:MAG TPA: hypothetical protein VHU19_14505 [Pyrinomonadaceae bacterium]|jgi:hypothetical protein|nr:hypothetical protein [Pyrinomonadaceae bacterium]